MRKLALAIVILSMFLTSVALAADGDTLRVHLYEDIQNLDPGFWPSDADVTVFMSVYEGLTRYIPGTFEYEPWLAEEIEFSDDGKDITFKLHEGIQFHEGYGELTAEDVKFSFERMADPEVNAVYGGDWSALDYVEITGKYTGIIHLKNPFAAIYDVLADTSGCIISKAAGEELGLSGLAMHPVGTGPYVFDRWEPNSKVVLIRNEEYWNEKPEWGELDYIYIPEESSVEIALETGEIDFGRVSPSIVGRFEGNPDFQIETIPTFDWNFMPINVQYPGLDDVNVRRAIRDAIDYEGINFAVYEDAYMPLCNMIVESQLGYWPEAVCHQRDLEKAKAYMEASGYDSLTIDLAIQNTEDEKTVGEIVQANLADIGITVNLNIEDDAAFVDEGFAPDAYLKRQLVYLNWINFRDPGMNTDYFTCSQIGQWNWSYWCNPEFDEKVEAAKFEMDREKRAQMYIELQQIVEDEVPMIFFNNITASYVSDKNLNTVLTPGGRMIPYLFTSK